MEAETRGIPGQYTALEAYPIDPQNVALLDYDEALTSNRLRVLLDAAWSEDVRRSKEFTLQKTALTLEEFLR